MISATDEGKHIFLPKTQLSLKSEQPTQHVYIFFGGGGGKLLQENTVLAPLSSAGKLST